MCFISFLFSSSGLLKTCQAICSDFIVVKLKSLKINKGILVHQKMTLIECIIVIRRSEKAL